MQAEAERAFAGLEALLGDVIDELLDGLTAPQRAAPTKWPLDADPMVSTRWVAASPAATSAHHDPG